MVSSFTEMFLSKLLCCIKNYSLLTQNNSAGMKSIFTSKDRHIKAIYCKKEKHISLDITDLVGHTENMCAVNAKHDRGKTQSNSNSGCSTCASTV